VNNATVHPTLAKNLGWLVVFAIAMAYLESAVVVYLREIYYPEGFDFPLKPIHSGIAIVEFWREVATIVMLAGIGILTGKSSSQRFAFFLLVFAIWDIFYYVFLYVLVGWPESLFTWDILFLVPVPWIGPVISPVLVSVLMIVLACNLIYFDKHLNKTEWTLSITGSLIIIISWILDYWNFLKSSSSAGIWTLSSDHDLFTASENYIPDTFNWYLFFAGISLLAVTTALFYFRNHKATLKN
jgi:hypothetical protein